jgi:hypothetical protein
VAVPFVSAIYVLLTLAVESFYFVNPTPVISNSYLRLCRWFRFCSRTQNLDKSRRRLTREVSIYFHLNVSCRRLALRMGVSNFTIWRTLHKQGLHLYLQRVQPLKPDPPR